METEVKANALRKLARAGQSPWYDNIDRRLIESGELKKLFETGILGVTSNPTIFEKAVSASGVYDNQIKSLSAKNKSPREICDILTIEDVSKAARLLTNTYEKSNHLDGYVSIEVLPELAHNPAETVRTAREIIKKINMPNIMIKVPATAEAPEAIRQLTKEGINVNMTLIFSVKHYEAGALAYIAGLKDRLKEKKDISNIFSVASVFISRVDTKIDKILENAQKENLKGRAAVANAKMIYQKFRKLFEPGSANIQRVLWASTSTKNPAYKDVKYVEELIGKETVNTMPPPTVEAFLDHGEVKLTVENGIDEARVFLTELKSLGIDIDRICQEIQDAGVKAFQASFDKLIHAIEQKKF